MEISIKSPTAGNQRKSGCICSTITQALLIIRVILGLTIVISWSLLLTLSDVCRASSAAAAAAADMLIKPQVQRGELIPIVATVQPPPPTLPLPRSPACLHQRPPHHSTRNIPPLIGLCSSNMFVMKKRRIILSLLAGRAQFTKVEVGDKQRQYG